VVAISTLLLVVAVSLLLTRVATVILIATGMSREQARFQARSAFSTAGFTTSESEKVVNHPIRRRVVMTLMLLGSAGTVAVISTLILGFGSHAGGGRRWWRILELVLGLLALVWFSRSRWVDRRLTNVIRAVLGRFTDLDDRDRASLLDLAADYAVNELSVAEGDWLAGRTLAELDLRHEGAVVLGITQVSGSYDPVPSGETRVVPGDTLIVYGPGRLLRELDVRRAGPEGDRAHQLAVEAHRRDKHAVAPAGR
jgi:MFS family permease